MKLRERLSSVQFIISAQQKELDELKGQKQSTLHQNTPRPAQDNADPTDKWTTVSNKNSIRRVINSATSVNIVHENRYEILPVEVCTGEINSGPCGEDSAIELSRKQGSVVPRKGKVSNRNPSSSSNQTGTSRHYTTNVLLDTSANGIIALHKKSGRPMSETSKLSLTRTVQIDLYADSQGRGIATELSKRSAHKINGVVKPGANFAAVTAVGGEKVLNMSRNDFSVFLGGTNDIATNSTKELRNSLKRRLLEFRNTNVIVFSVAHRHDLPEWSCVNKEIRNANTEIQNICRRFENVKFVDISELGRRFHTNHGLHLNKVGKKLITNKILEIVGEKLSLEHEISSVIPLKDNSSVISSTNKCMNTVTSSKDRSEPSSPKLGTTNDPENAEEICGNEDNISTATRKSTRPKKTPSTYKDDFLWTESLQTKLR